MSFTVIVLHLCFGSMCVNQSFPVDPDQPCAIEFVPDARDFLAKLAEGWVVKETRCKR